MNVAYVGNFKAPWCTEVHVAASLEALGHTVTRLQEQPMLDWPGVVTAARAADAQLLLWTRTWDQDGEACLKALAELRADGVPSAFYHLDRWWGLEREYQVHSEPFFRCDVVFSPDGGNDQRWLDAGVNHRWLPPGVFGPECTGGRADPRRYPYDVVFVGSSPYPHTEWAAYRAELLARLREAYGPRFGVLPGSNPGGARRRPIRGRDLTSLYATAKVVVGDSCLAGGATHYWSDRVPETLGRGGFLIHPEVEGLRDWYSPADLPTYPVGDFDTLLHMVDHYLNTPDEREAVRAHGQATVLGRDTYLHRMATVLDVMTREVGVRPARPKPVRVTHPRTRTTATFTLAQGDTDATAVQEVWATDDYRLVAADVRGKVVVDVGANVGAFSVLAAKMGAKVWAYEPHPDNAQALVTNLHANGVADRVRVYQAAVWPEGGSGFELAGDGGGAHIGALEGEATHSVLGLDMAEVLAEAGGSIDLLKLDCEGAEYAILLGQANFAGDPFAGGAPWLAHVAAIAMEYHGPHMPHLQHLDADGRHLQRWGAMVAVLADYGRVETFGHPRAGGLLHWRRY